MKDLEHDLDAVRIKLVEICRGADRAVQRCLRRHGTPVNEDEWEEPPASFTGHDLANRLESRLRALYSEIEMLSSMDYDGRRGNPAGSPSRAVSGGSPGPTGGGGGGIRRGDVRFVRNEDEVR